MSRDVPTTADGITPPMDGCRKRHGNNPTGGRFETDEDVVVALKILLEAGDGYQSQDRQTVSRR